MYNELCSLLLCLERIVENKICYVSRKRIGNYVYVINLIYKLQTPIIRSR